MFTIQFTHKTTIVIYADYGDKKHKYFVDYFPGEKLEVIEIFQQTHNFIRAKVPDGDIVTIKGKVCRVVPSSTAAGGNRCQD